MMSDMVDSILFATSTEMKVTHVLAATSRKAAEVVKVGAPLQAVYEELAELDFEPVSIAVDKLYLIHLFKRV